MNSGHDPVPPLKFGQFLGPVIARIDYADEVAWIESDFRGIPWTQKIAREICGIRNNKVLAALANTPTHARCIPAGHE